jgi:putative hydrolase of the HAD superfamily
VRQQVQLYDQALHVLAELADHYTLGALTNGNADVYRTDAGEYFDFAFLAEEVGASKPAPDMFHAALARTDAAPETVVHVGDHPSHDVAGAQAVGMRAIWVNAAGTAWTGEREPDAVIRGLIELPAAIRAISGA